MNKTYRIIFNKALGVLQVVSELAKSHGKKSAGKSSVGTTQANNNAIPHRMRAISMAAAAVLATTLLMGTAPAMAQANNGGNGTSSAGGVGGTGINGAGSGGNGSFL
jgi:hypothetical protein